MELTEAYDHLDNMVGAGVNNADEIEAINTIRKELSGSGQNSAELIYALFQAIMTRPHIEKVLTDEIRNSLPHWKDNNDSPKSLCLLCRNSPHCVAIKMVRSRITCCEGYESAGG